MDPFTLAILAGTTIAASLFADARRRSLPPVIIQVLYKDQDERLIWQTTWLRSPEALRLAAQSFDASVDSWIGKIAWRDHDNSSFRAITVVRIGGNPDQKALVLLRRIGTSWQPIEVFGSGYRKPPLSVDDAIGRMIRAINAESAYALWPGDLISMKFNDRTAVVRLVTWSSVKLQSLACENGLYDWMKRQADPDLFAFKIASAAGEDPMVSFAVRRDPDGFSLVQAAGYRNGPVAPLMQQKISSFLGALNARGTTDAQRQIAVAPIEDRPEVTVDDRMLEDRPDLSDSDTDYPEAQPLAPGSSEEDPPVTDDWRESGLDALSGEETSVYEDAPTDADETTLFDDEPPEKP